MTLTYDGNKNENYDLLLDGVIVAELFLGEDAVRELVTKIDKFLNENIRNSPPTTASIKNDSDIQPMGVIVDIWDQLTGQWLDGETYWFDDFI